MKHFLTAVSIACTGLFYLSMGFAISLSASQVDSVLEKRGYNPNSVDYSRLGKETGTLPPVIGNIDTPDVTINTKYEAAIALEWNDAHWVNSILLLKEMQRTYPKKSDSFQKNIKEMQRTYPKKSDSFQKNIDNIKKSKGVTDKQIEDAYIVQLKEFCANNQQFTFYVKGTRQISPEVSILLRYLTASPSDCGKYKSDIIRLAKNLTVKSLSDGHGSIARNKQEEFSIVISNYQDIEDFVMPEVDKIYAQI